MPISEQRLTLFALISEFETDIRYQISKVEPELACIERAIGNQALVKATTRAGPEHTNSPASLELLSHLELSDELKLLVYLKNELPSRLQMAIDETKKRLFELCSIRNRVMHRRPLSFDDYPTTQAIINRFRKLCPTEFVNVNSVYESIEAGQLSRTYRHVDLESSDTLITNNLPQPDFDDTGFIGRAEKIKELKKAITGPYPVITILGVGGVGKTALALQVAYDLAADPTTPYDAIIWVSAKATRLTGSDIENIVGAITSSSEIAALAVEEIVGEVEGDSFEQLLSILSHFNILLFVDNLETILDDRIRSFVKSIPEGSKIIFTSRVGLGAFDFTIELSGLTLSQSVAFFRRVADVWGQKNLLGLSEDTINGYIKRLSFSPLGIKWFIQAVSKGSSVQRLLSDPKDLLSFCLDNILDKLTTGAKAVLYALAISGKDQSPASLAYLCEVEGAAIEDSLTELLASNLIMVITGRFGDDDRYKIAFLAMGYISRFKPPPKQFQERIRVRLGQLKAASERAIADDPGKYVYHPSFIFVRREFADTDAVAAQHLKTALVSCRSGDYANATAAVSRARAVAPTYFEVHMIEGFIAAQEGNYLLALGAYEEAYALRPEYPPLLVLFAGFLLRNHDDHDRALKLLEEARAIDPSEFTTQFEIIRAHMFKQELELAWLEWEKVDSSAFRNVRTERIYHDLSIDVCRRAIDNATTERDNAAFVIFAKRLEALLKNMPSHVADNLMIEKLTHAAALTRRFSLREKGTPDGETVEQVRRVILATILTAREGVEAKPTMNATADREQSGPLSEDSDRMNGRVTSLLPEKCFGFVENDDSQRFFFHRNFFDVRQDFDDLAIGDRLTFILGKNHQGPCATQLQRERS